MKLWLPIILLLISSPLSAQEDLFDFIPPGGRTILMQLLASNPAFEEDLCNACYTDGWAERLAALDPPCLETFDEWQCETLADYLTYAAPIQDIADLVWDGRDMTLGLCQSCHIVTVVITQARTREAWLGTMNKPSHIEVPLTDAEREQLADYLVVNAGLPIDAVPPELRAGGASY